MAARLTCAAETNVGLKRTNNEDNYGMVPSQGLYVLADGMGGHASGQVASTMCVSHVAQFICDTARKPGFEFPYPSDSKLSYEANLLVNAIKFANERIFIQSCKERSMEGMGTTVTAIMNSPRGLILAHVGDSRIYRVRKGQIVQMTRDHSLLNHLLDTGELKPEDAKNFANKNVILRAIGLKDYVDVEVKEVPREPGDTYMMCSDGLSDIVSEALICQAITTHPDLTEACHELIGLALKAGGKDNVTVVCVHVEGDDVAVSQSSPAVNRAVPPVPGAQPVPGSQGGMSPAAGQPGGRMPMDPMMQQQMMQQQMMQQQMMQQQMMQQQMMQQQMMRGGYPGGMGGVPGQRMGVPMGHAGMAPMPMGRPGMPTPTMAPPQQVQPAAPQRMHSVREIVIVEAPPVQRSMPKFIGGRGGTGMAPIPGKPRSASSEENSSVSRDGAQMPEKAAEERVASQSGEGLRKVNEISPEDKTLLPETELLLSEPPSAASPTEDENSSVRTMTDCAVVDDETLRALEVQQRAELESSEIVPGIRELEMEDGDEEDDGDKTKISPMPMAGMFVPPGSTPPPSVAQAMASPSDFAPASPASPVSAPSAPGQASIPGTSSTIPGMPPTASAPSLEAPSFSYSKVADPDPLPSKPKGYVAPKEAGRPHDYDYDDDSIEIAGGYEMGDEDDDDDDVTRQYIRPPINKW